jgi:hypothetical protein
MAAAATLGRGRRRHPLAQRRQKGTTMSKGQNGNKEAKKPKKAPPPAPPPGGAAVPTLVAAQPNRAKRK